MPSEWNGKYVPSNLDDFLPSESKFTLKVYGKKLCLRIAPQIATMEHLDSGDFIRICKSLTWKRNFKDIDMYISTYVSFLTLGIQIFMSLCMSPRKVQIIFWPLPSPMAHEHIERYLLITYSLNAFKWHKALYSPFYHHFWSFFRQLDNYPVCRKAFLFFFFDHFFFPRKPFLIM